MTGGGRISWSSRARGVLVAAGAVLQATSPACERSGRPAVSPSDWGDPGDHAAAVDADAPQLAPDQEWLAIPAGHEIPGTGGLIRGNLPCEAVEARAGALPYRSLTWIEEQRAFRESRRPAIEASLERNRIERDCFLRTGCPEVARVVGMIDVGPGNIFAGSADSTWLAGNPVAARLGPDGSVAVLSPELGEIRQILPLPSGRVIAASFAVDYFGEEEDTMPHLWAALTLLRADGSIVWSKNLKSEAPIALLPDGRSVVFPLSLGRMCGSESQYGCWAGLMEVDIETGDSTRCRPAGNPAEHFSLWGFLVSEDSIYAQSENGVSAWPISEGPVQHLDFTDPLARNGGVSDTPPVVLDERRLLVRDFGGYHVINRAEFTEEWYVGFNDIDEPPPMLSDYLAQPALGPGGRVFQNTRTGLAMFQLQPSGWLREIAREPVFCAEPLVAEDGTIICYYQGRLMAVEPDELQVLWWIDTTSIVHVPLLFDDGMLVLPAVDGRLLYIQTSHGGLARTGAPTQHMDNRRSNVAPAGPYQTERTPRRWRWPGEPDDMPGAGEPWPDADEGSEEGSGAP